MTFTLITMGDSLNLKWVGTPKHLLFPSYQKWRKSSAFLSAIPRVAILTYHSPSKGGREACGSLCIGVCYPCANL